MPFPNNPTQFSNSCTVLHSCEILSCHSQTIPHNSLVHVAEGNNFGRSSSHSLCSSRITAQEKKLKNKSSHHPSIDAGAVKSRMLIQLVSNNPHERRVFNNAQQKLIQGPTFVNLLCGTNLQTSFALLQLGQTCDDMECPSTIK